MQDKLRVKCSNETTSICIATQADRRGLLVKAVPALRIMKAGQNIQFPTCACHSRGQAVDVILNMNLKNAAIIPQNNRKQSKSTQQNRVRNKHAGGFNFGCLENQDITQWQTQCYAMCRVPLCQACKFFTLLAAEGGMGLVLLFAWILQALGVLNCEAE